MYIRTITLVFLLMIASLVCGRNFILYHQRALLADRYGQ